MNLLDIGTEATPTFFWTQETSITGIKSLPALIEYDIVSYKVLLIIQNSKGASYENFIKISINSCRKPIYCVCRGSLVTPKTKGERYRFGIRAFIAPLLSGFAESHFLYSG